MGRQGGGSGTGILRLLDPLGILIIIGIEIDVSAADAAHCAYHIRHLHKKGSPFVSMPLL